MVEVKLGAATATRIEESYEPNFEAPKFFPDWKPSVLNEHRDWLVSNHYDAGSNFLKLSIHSWLLRIGGKTILIDTCVGNHKSRKHRPKWDMMNTPYLDRLKAAGVTPDQVDMVMCTHLHVDHVGWNTQLENGRWVPTFKNAKYVWSQEDFDFYKALDADPQKGPANGGSFRDSVLPVVEAGKVQMVKGGAEIEDGLKVAPAIHPARCASSSNRRAGRRCSAATSCTTPCRSITRSGTASPASTRTMRARAGARRSSIVPAAVRCCCRATSARRSTAT
jgi:Metallo-beta-lactamase superfamily